MWEYTTRYWGTVRLHGEDAHHLSASAKTKAFSMAKRQPRTRRGRALERDDKTLERLALTTPSDVEDARLWWREHAPRGFKSLLEAGGEET